MGSRIFFVRLPEEVIFGKNFKFKENYFYSTLINGGKMDFVKNRPE